MREIKFRAWNDSQKRMFFDKEWYRFFEDGTVWRREAEYWVVGKTPLKIMQYTGLKDKNGVEIYEGDILEDFDADGEHLVEWDEPSASFCLVRYGWREGRDLKRREVNLDGDEKVIGNIYENPEILEVSDVVG